MKMNRNKRKPVLGEIIYSLNIGNAARNCEQELTQTKVQKIGRKYFWCGDDSHTWGWKKYRIDDWSHDNGGYVASSCLYETIKEFEDENEERRICSFLANSFQYGHNTRSIPLGLLKEIEVKLVSFKEGA